MKNAVRKLFAILMVLVMFFDAAPVAAVAEALQTEGQSALEETIRTPETPIITDAAEGQQFGVVLPEEPLVEESHTLTEGEYSVIPVEDPSGLLDLINSIPEMRDGAKSRQRVMKDAMIINNRRVVDYVAYDIELTENAAAAKEYNVTVPVGLDMLKDFRDSKQDFDISNISYQLYHIHTDENDETSVEEIGVSVTGENGWIDDFSFTVDSFSSFVLKYTVDFVYRIKSAEICVDFENEKEDGGELPHISYNDILHYTELTVAGILADAPAVSDDTVPQDAVYAVYLHDDTVRDDFDQAFFADAAVEVAGDGVAYSDGAVRLTGDVTDATVTFISGMKLLTVEIKNYVAPPIIPEDTDGFVYRFFGIGEKASVDDILKNCDIIASYESAEVSDAGKVTAEEDILTAADYFDEVILTVVLSDGTEIEITLTNPAPIKAGTLIATEGVGSFTAAEDVPAGTRLVVEADPDIPDSLDFDSGAKRDGSEESDPVFFNVSLVGPDGEPVETRAQVTILTNIALPAEEGKITKVKGVNVYRIGEQGDAEPLDGAAYSLAEGRIASVSFTTPGFSLFAVTYTVEYIENGKAYSIVGGGVLSLRELLDGLGIQGIRTEEIANVAFSDEELVKAVKVEEDTTAGELKAALGLAPSYSAELTADDIAQMDQLALTAPDWALISLKPFKTDEALTITLADGTEYTIAVTDGQIVRYYIDSKGDTYEITVTYEDDAEIPEDAELVVAEILPEDEEYADYLAQAIEALGGGEPAEDQFARFFDITIMSGEEKVQPKADVSVSIKLAGAPEDGDLTVVHFDGENGLVVMQAETKENDTKAAAVEIEFKTQSFSVYAVIAVPGDEPSGANDLNGRTVIMSRENRYITASQVTLTDGDNTTALGKGIESEAAKWLFEDSGTAGVYNISTVVNGQKQYLNFTQQNTNRANAVLSSTAQPITVTQVDGAYRLSYTINGTTYNLDEHNGSNGPGFAGWHQPGDNSLLNFDFVQQPLATDLGGRTFKIQQNGRYMTSTIFHSSNIDTFKNTNNPYEAAIWQFENAGEEGKYYIFTEDNNGNRQYLGMKTHGDSPIGDVLWNDTTNRQAFTVTKPDNNSYTISIELTRGESTKRFYLLEENQNLGFVAESRTDSNYNYNLTLDFTEPVISSGTEYIVVIKYGGKYYAVQNEGDLEEVEYDDAKHTVKMESPMFWTFASSADGQNYVLYHPDEAYDYTYQQLASDYFYRYIDPRQDDALSLDDETNTEAKYRWVDGHWELDLNIGGKQIGTRQLMTDAAITYNNNTIASVSDPSKALKVINVGGQLKIAGGDVEGDVAEVYLAKLVQPEHTLILGPKYHTVDHIDISVEARAAVHVPLAFGTYYYTDSDGNVKTLEVSREHQVTLNLSEKVEIEADDLRKGTITAYKKDPTTGKPILDEDNEFFIVNGYSGNKENGQSTDQVRIAGVFKVADLDNVPSGYFNNDDPNGDNSDENYIGWREKRLAPENRIYYTVSTTKEVEYPMLYNGRPLCSSENEARAAYANEQASGSGYEALKDDNVLKVKPSVTLSASFDYWDPRNECPGIHLLGKTGGWVAGDIWTSYDPSAGVAANSGMDFALGTTDESEANVKAIEITKYIVDKGGNRIALDHGLTSLFHVYTKSFYKDDTPNPLDEMKNLDVDEYDPDDGRNETVNDGYSYFHDKKVAVGRDGMGVVYDYDMSDSLVYVEEDQSPEYLPKEITDKNGKIWQYTYTYFETEYVWRDDGIEYRRHVSDNYTSDDEAYNSIPDAVGAYRDVNGLDQYNGFLEFYAYNVYEPLNVDIPVEKKWLQENGSPASAPENARITVTLGRYHLVEDTENPITGSLNIGQTVSGLAPNTPFYATYNIKKDGEVVRTVNYTGYADANGTITGSMLVTGLRAAENGTDYTVEISGGAEGYDVTHDHSSQTVTITRGGTAETSFSSTCTVKQEVQTVTLIVTNSIDGNTNYQNIEYVFPTESQILLNISRPGPGHNNAFHVTITVTDNNGAVTTYAYQNPPEASQGENAYAGVTQSLPFTLPASGTYRIDIWHDWGRESLTVDSVTLRKPEENTSTLNTNTENLGGLQMGGVRRLLSKDGGQHGGTSALGQTADNTGSIPASTVEGMKYAVDTVMVDGVEQEWSRTLVLADGQWKQYLEDMPSTDDNGNEYLYFIMHVEEEGLPEGTNASTQNKPVITLGTDGEILTSNGETTLSFTNTVPNQPVNLSIKKVDENGVPMTGVQFELLKTGSAAQPITITSGDGVYTFEELTAGSYTITETSTLQGYQSMQGSIRFAIDEHFVLTYDSLPTGVVYDGNSFCFTITNNPVNSPNTLVVRKQWLDYNGNVTRYNGTIDLKLEQILSSDKPSHTVTFNFMYTGGDGNGKQENEYTDISDSTRYGTGVGDVSISWDWNQWTDEQQIYISGLAGNTYDYIWSPEGVNYQQYGKGRQTLTIHNISQDLNITVVIRNNGYDGTNSNLIYQPSFAGDVIGGTKTVHLGENGAWSQVFNVSGDGLLTESSTTLPQTYSGMNCNYRIVEESVPEGYVLQQISDAVTTSGVLTAYNKRLAADITVVKVDKDNRGQRLAGATFELRTINPKHYGVAYLNDTVRTGTTESNGSVSFTNLSLGYYEIRETAAPTNYKIIGDGCYYINVTPGGVVWLERNDTKFPEAWRVRSNNSVLSISNDVITIGNEPVGALNVQKILQASTSNPVGGDRSKGNGSVIFTVYDPQNMPIKYVKIIAYTANKDAATVYTYLMADTLQALEELTDAPATVPDGGVVIDDLPLGTYTVAEGEWQWDTTPTDYGIYLKDIQVTNADGTPNLANKRTTVVVGGSGAEYTGTPTATFTNELVPNTVNVEKQITDINDSTMEGASNGESSEGTHHDSADYDVGDRIPYRVRGFLPQATYKSLNSYYYQVVDEMVNLTYQASPERAHMYAFVKAGEVGEWYQVDEYFTINFSGGTLTATCNDLKAITGGYKVTDWGAPGADTHGRVFPTSAARWQAVKTPIDPNNIEYLELRYWATLDSDAYIGGAAQGTDHTNTWGVSANTGNPNAAKIVYSDTATTTTSSHWDVNKVFTYKLVVNKQDNDGDALNGSNFELFKKYNGKYPNASCNATIPSGWVQCSVDTNATDFGTVTLIGPADAMPSGATTSDAASSYNSTVYVYVAKTSGSSAGNSFAWERIDDGRYVLIETATPNNYESLAGPVAFGISADHDPTSPDPQLTGLSIGSTYVNGDSDSGLITKSNDSSTGTVSLTIRNNPQTMELNVTKEWNLNDSAKQNPNPNSISFTLHQVLTATGYTTIDAPYTAYGTNHDGGGTVTYDSSNNRWNTVTISNLPKAVTRTENGVPVTYTASYYVVETAPNLAAGHTLVTTYQTTTGTAPDETTSSPTGTASDAALSADGTITIINDETAKGSLKITKEVKVNGNYLPNDGSWEWVNGTYTFRITHLDGTTPAEGKVNGTPIVNGEVQITIANEQSNTIEVTDVPEGNYIIQEVGVPSCFEITVSSEGPVHVTAGQTGNNAPTTTFTNNYETTSVSLTKTWDDTADPHHRPTAEQFKSKVHLKVGDTVITTSTAGYSAMTVTAVDNSNGTYTVTWSNLPKKNNGADIAYTVTEDSDLSEYYTAGTPVFNSVTEKWEVTNTRKTGSLTIKKELTLSDNGTKPSPAKVYEFTVYDGTNYYYLNNGTLATSTTPDSAHIQVTSDVTTGVTLTGLPTGTYTVTEVGDTAITNYTLASTTYSVDSGEANSEAPSVNVTTDGLVTVTATNTYNPNPGSLVIVKQITPEGTDASSATFTFEVTFTKADHTAYVGNVKVTDATRTTETTVTTDNSGKLTVTITGAGSATITEIPAGTSYTVVETVPTGWEQSGTVVITGGNANQTIDPGETETATITNTKQISIYAKKVWKQGETEMTGWPADVTSVTFQLQEKAKTEGAQWTNVENGEKTVNTLNTVSWDNLTPTMDYQVVETAITKTGGTTQPVNVVVTGSGTETDPFVITNPVETISIPVEKAWTGTPPAGTTVEVELVKVANDADVPFTPAKTLTLQASDTPTQNWKGEFTGLDKYNADGTAITYKVKETKVTYNGQEYTGTNLTTAFGNDGKASGNIVSTGTIGTAAISNTVETKSISAKKTWNHSETWPENMSVTFTLSASAGEAAYTIPNGSYGANVPSVTISSRQTVEWTNLPKYTIVDGNATEITYSVAETAVMYNNAEISGYRTTVYNVTGEGTGTEGVVTIDNTPTTIVLTVNKEWFQNNVKLTGDSFLPDATITVKVEQSTDGKTWTVAKDSEGTDIVNVILRKTDNWSKTWSGLPAYTMTGTAIQYRVTETAATVNTTDSLDVASQTAVEFTNGTATLSNNLPTRNIVVEKAWSPDTWPSDIASVTVGLYKTVAGTETPVTTGDPAAHWTITFDGNSDVSHRTFSDLPVYDSQGAKIVYTVQEEKITAQDDTEGTVTGSAVTVNGQTWTVLNGEVSNGTATVTNTLTSISIQVTKEWTKAGSPKTTATSIGFELHQVLKPASGTPIDRKYIGYSNETAGITSGDGTVTYDKTHSRWNTVTIPNLPITVTSTVGEGDIQNEVSYTASYYVKETSAAADAGYVLAAETYKLNNGEPVSDANGAVATANGDKITIINTETAGVELPATGGPGTLVYTVTGLTLTLGAALWLILSRRKREQN